MTKPTLTMQERLLAERRRRERLEILENAAEGAGSPHDPVTLAAALDLILALTGQELDLDVQSANEVLAGPVSGADAQPTFRTLVPSDVPALDYAPDDAQFLTLALDGDLDVERVFTPGYWLGAMDGGANGNYTLNLLMDTVILHDGSSVIGEYTTLALAIAAASSGDTIYLPPGTYTGDHTIPAGVTLAGMVREACVLTGQITTRDLSHVENLTIDRDEDSADTVYGLIGPAVGEVAYAKGVTISVANVGAGTGVGLSTTGRGDFGKVDNDPGLEDCAFVGCDTDITR